MVELRHFRTTLMVGLVVVLALATLSGCQFFKTSSRSFDDIVGSIARSQDVDKSVVRRAIDESATSSESRMGLAKQWEDDLPERPIPNLESTWDDLAEYGREQLKSATCEAVLDTLRTNEVPDGPTFIRNYLGNLSSSVPAAELNSIAAEFNELWLEAKAGTLTVTDVRFTLMKHAYC